jgi:hypothetical protein
VPKPGAPIDLAQAARLLNHYLPGVRTELRAAVAAIRRNHPGKAIHVREWRPEEVVAHWGPELDRVLVGFVVVDDQGHPARWRSVLVLIDKLDGELVVADDSGLLG